MFTSTEYTIPFLQQIIYNWKSVSTFICWFPPFPNLPCKNGLDSWHWPCADRCGFFGADRLGCCSGRCGKHSLHQPLGASSVDEGSDRFCCCHGSKMEYQFCVCHFNIRIINFWVSIILVRCPNTQKIESLAFLDKIWRDVADSVPYPIFTSKFWPIQIWIEVLSLWTPPYRVNSCLVEIEKKLTASWFVFAVCFQVFQAERVYGLDYLGFMVPIWSKM